MYDITNLAVAVYNQSKRPRINVIRSMHSIKQYIRSKHRSLPPRIQLIGSFAGVAVLILLVVWICLPQKPLSPSDNYNPHAKLQSACSVRYPHIPLQPLADTVKQRSDHYFIAANLYNNEPIIEHWLLQLYRLIELIHNHKSSIQESNIYVSLYESGSNDRTSNYLDTATDYLTQLGVPHTIVTNGKITKQSIMRKIGRYHRIAYLADLRNAALQPLYHSSSGTFQRVIFMNDIMYCAEDVIWLMTDDYYGNHGSDMLCGMDFDLNEKNNIKFYDNWVTKDIAGMPLQHNYPGITYHKQSRQLIQLMSITPVQCCWNGLVSINADVFYSGIRFRYGGFADNLADQWKCTASEITHFCDDMWASGYGKIGIEPIVQVSYDAQTHLLLSDHQQQWVKKSFAARITRLHKMVESVAGFEDDDTYNSSNAREKRASSHYITYNEQLTASILPSSSELAVTVANQLYDYELNYQTPLSESWTCCAARPNSSPAHWCCAIDHPLDRIGTDMIDWTVGEPWNCGWQQFNVT